MPPALTQLQQKIDSRVLRERVLLFLTALALVFLLWSLMFQNAIDARQSELSNQLNNVRTQRQALDAQIATVSLAVANNPNTEKQNTIATLKAERAQLDADLANLSQGLVSAAELPQILQDVLLQTGELKLVQMQTLPVQELQLVRVASIDGSESKGAGVFKHEVVLKVSGNYFQVLTFLTSLETTRWRFYWEQLDYAVTEYPNADVELRVYTLSAEKGLLGV
ncbi:MSHA biogenesis protein MshJ [Cellvibrio sp. ARAG 10.3]|uniref:MSHA biogenesis protein MshJ n=1 Tax=Cellvibrio sp. ARAG 10.3 TaxID=3451358 RepID=UPI003F46AE4C